jgi:hypothetical protein
MFGICHKSSRLLERSFMVDLIQGAYMQAWNINAWWISLDDLHVFIYSEATFSLHDEKGDEGVIYTRISSPNPLNPM